MIRDSCNGDRRGTPTPLRHSARTAAARPRRGALSSRSSGPGATTTAAAAATSASARRASARGAQDNLRLPRLAAVAASLTQTDASHLANMPRSSRTYHGGPG